jgi:hypothetical protein
MRMLAVCALAACGTAAEGEDAAAPPDSAAATQAPRADSARGDAAARPGNADPRHEFRLHETRSGVVDSITVTRGGRVTQTIVPSENHVLPETGVERISRTDIDFDGARDLAFVTELGMANSRSEYWRQDPRTGRFEPAGVFETLQPDSAAREHVTHNRGGHGGRLWTASRWRWMDGRLVEVRREGQDWAEDAERYVRIVHEHRGGKLAETTRDTLDETEVRPGPSWMEP